MKRERLAMLSGWLHTYLKWMTTVAQRARAEMFVHTALVLLREVRQP
jgi:hypothetical protein